MIQTKQELLNVLNANRDKILSFGVERLGLFGSFVRDEANEKSDVDFLVEFKEDSYTFRNLIDLGDYLQNLYHRKIELVTPNSLSKHFGHKILNSTEYVLRSN